jgi:hypothetical protein
LTFIIIIIKLWPLINLDDCKQKVKLLGILKWYSSTYRTFFKLVSCDIVNARVLNLYMGCLKAYHTEQALCLDAIVQMSFLLEFINDNPVQ